MNVKEFKTWAKDNGYMLWIDGRKGKFFFILKHDNKMKNGELVADIVNAVNQSEKERLLDAGCRFDEYTKFGEAWVWDLRYD